MTYFVTYGAKTFVILDNVLLRTRDFKDLDAVAALCIGINLRFSLREYLRSDIDTTLIIYLVYS